MRLDYTIGRAIDLAIETEFRRAAALAAKAQIKESTLARWRWRNDSNKFEGNSQILKEEVYTRLYPFIKRHLPKNAPHYIPRPILEEAYRSQNIKFEKVMEQIENLSRFVKTSAHLFDVEEDPYVYLDPIISSATEQVFVLTESFPTLELPERTGREQHLRWIEEVIEYKAKKNHEFKYRRGFMVEPGKEKDISDLRPSSLEHCLNVFRAVSKYPRTKVFVEFKLLDPWCPHGFVLVDSTYLTHFFDFFDEDKKKNHCIFFDCKDCEGQTLKAWQQKILDRFEREPCRITQAQVKIALNPN